MIQNMESNATAIIQGTLKGNPAVHFSIGSGWGFRFRSGELARYLVRFGQRRIGLHVNEDQTGVVLFYPSTASEKRFADIINEVRLVLFAIGPFRAWRVWQRKRRIEIYQRAFAQYLHCWYLGVLPGHRNITRAAALRAVLFRESDRLQIPVLAETTMVRNRDAYARMGFRVYAEVAVGGMKTYLLCREPSKL
jgi:hypothetical protein